MSDELLPLNRPDYLAHPAPWWERLRDEAPAYFSPERGFWAVSRYDDVVAVLHDPERFSSRCGPGGGVQEEGSAPFLPMIQNDPPDHGRLRRILSRAFTPRSIDLREPRVRAIAAGLVAEMRARAARGEPVDLVEHFASPLPVGVIAEILGIPESLRDRLRLWHGATSVAGGMSLDLKERGSITGEMYQTLAELLEERRASPRDDLFSSLIAASESDEMPLRPDELVGLCLLLWLAGNETTTNLISNAALRMQQEPALLETLRARPELAKPWVEETLRLETPVVGLFRQTSRDVELHGEKLREGEMILVMFAAANRDPRHFHDPERFDPTRRPNDHVGFGHGIHFCLGSHLARLETRVAYDALLELLPGARLAPDEGARIPAGMLRGWLHLPLHFEARKRIEA